jgi:type IV pilus assembly protein PilB
VRFVNKILLDAIKKGASDIHFEPYEKIFRIRTRLDGVLKEVALPPVQLAIKIVARLKVMARLDIAERRVRRTAASRCASRRTEPSIFASAHARRCSARRSSLVFSIPRAPCWASTRWDTSRPSVRFTCGISAKPQGMILVTGPTGSGKTVSLYTGLNILNTEDCNISTAEDPAEINLPGINQVNVNNKVGLTFAAALRAFLRQDPDVIMVGEIRDLETAEIAIKAAQTGHLVLSTLHTNDAPQTLTRLVDMGVKPYAIATSVSLIIAQRLARKLCSNCKQPIDIPAEALRKEGFRGCGHRERHPNLPRGRLRQCTDGYKGRMGSTKSCRSPKPSAASSWKAAVRSTSATRPKDGIWNLRRAGLEKVRRLDEFGRSQQRHDRLDGDGRIELWRISIRK